MQDFVEWSTTSLLLDNHIGTKFIVFPKIKEYLKQKMKKGKMKYTYFSMKQQKRNTNLLRTKCIIKLQYLVLFCIYPNNISYFSQILIQNLLDERTLMRDQISLFTKAKKLTNKGSHSLWCNLLDLLVHWPKLLLHVFNLRK